MSQPASLESELRDLILRGLGQQYMSIVSTTGADIQTGNHYQSLALGDIRTKGFRDDRAKILDQIDFAGKTVLDLGSNLGELSREARARGASLVDGFEYDPYFIEIAELVNALTGTTRVSFYERDIGDPDVYAEHYDMVLAFAVMGQGASKTLWRIAEVTDVMVFETHRLEGTFEKSYMEPVSRYFPHHRMLGESGWGATFDRHEVRATLIFAKTEEALENALLDAVPVLDEPVDPTAGDGANAAERHVDVSRTALQEKFFDTFSFDSMEELIAAVAGMNVVDAAALARSHDSRVKGYNGWVLWFLCLRGYILYARVGEVGRGNPYFDYLSAHHDLAGDPTVGQQVDWDSMGDYIKRQFDDMDRMRDAAGNPEVREQIAPIQVFTSERVEGRLMVYEPGAPHPIPGTRVDGWHRLFAAKLFEVPQLRMEVIEETEAKPIFGEIEALEFDGNRLRVSGWCMDTDDRLDLVEARLGEATVLGSTVMTLREDISDRFAHVSVTLRRRKPPATPHLAPGRTGFALDKELPPEARTQTDGADLIRFRLTALQDWLPIGEISVFYLPGMFDRPWPDEELAQRLMGTGDPRRLSIDSLRRLHAMLEPVKRYRGLDSFATVLDWGCRAGFLEAFVSHFMPDAEVVGIDSDPEAVEWSRASDRAGTFSVVDALPPTDLPADSFDLVLGHSMLSRLRVEEQSAWLQELRRVMKSGGYALLTLNGELLRRFIKDEDVRAEVDARGISSELLERYPDGSREAVPWRGTFQTKEYSIREYSSTFDVLRYAAGALNDQDLIILRKP